MSLKNDAARSVGYELNIFFFPNKEKFWRVKIFCKDKDKIKIDKGKDKGKGKDKDKDKDDKDKINIRIWQEGAAENESPPDTKNTGKVHYSGKQQEVLQFKSNIFS